MVLFFFYPVFAHRMRGSFRGSLWIAAGFLIGTILGVVHYSGILPLYVEMTLQQHILITASYLLVSMLSYFVHRQQESYVGDLVEKIMYDEITGLPNKSVLSKTLSVPDRRMFAVLRIENFADLGTMFGFSLSGSLVSFVAHRLVEEKDKYGYHVYRLKDNDFGLLFPHPAAFSEKSETILSSLCDDLAALPMLWNDKDFDVSVKIGAVIVDETVVGGIIPKADAALKVAESLHKKAIVFGAFSDNNPFSEQDDIYQVLLRNRLNHEFKSYFQPVRHAGDGTIIWYECLLRVRDSAGVYQNPLPYLAVARTTGIDSYIAQFMVEEACFAIIRTGYSFSINLTGADLMRDELVGDICRKMEEIRGLEGTLIIECTGSELESNALCVGNLARLKVAGCRIAIDDFGAGFNNFLNLLKIDADYIKIDGSLVTQSIKDEQTEFLLKGIAQICQRSGKKVVAEFVENEEIAHRMKMIGIDCLQGYYCGYPADRIA
ncbi:MAG: EAL domain-containing protein [Spirochaetota bacterium]